MLARLTRLIMRSCFPLTKFQTRFYPTRICNRQIWYKIMRSLFYVDYIFDDHIPFSFHTQYAAWWKVHLQLSYGVFLDQRTSGHAFVDVITGRDHMFSALVLRHGWTITRGSFYMDIIRYQCFGFNTNLGGRRYITVVTWHLNPVKRHECIVSHPFIHW